MTDAAREISPKPLHTHFLPAERCDAQTVRHQASLLDDSPLIQALLDSRTGATLILNSKRQIVTAGNGALKFTEGSTLDQLLGLRPGEAIGCSHSKECPGGCGTSAHCRECGAANAILAAVNGHHSEQECRIIQNTSEGGFKALELLVNATPFVNGGEHFVILSISDISHEKRRKTLERVFFHDVINLAGGIQGLLEQIHLMSAEDQSIALQMSRENIHDLIEEIMIQRDLVAAERDELMTKPVIVDSMAILQQLAAVYQAHPVSLGKHMVLKPGCESFELKVDATLLKRVMGNLIKNASEASLPGQTITISCARQAGRGIFTVHNQTVMPLSVQHQIFQRSFSTKGEGRGLGTYSVKLFGERYLGGTVSFCSHERDGTSFCLSLPL